MKSQLKAREAMIPQDFLRSQDLGPDSVDRGPEAPESLPGTEPGLARERGNAAVGPTHRWLHCLAERSEAGVRNCEGSPSITGFPRLSLGFPRISYYCIRISQDCNQDFYQDFLGFDLDLDFD